MTLNTQLLTMVTMIIGGIYVGFAQETYRRLVAYWRRYVILKYVLEILFWLVQSIILFYLLYRVNNGEIRLYIILACLLGLSLYFVLFQSMYKKMLEWLIRLFLRILTMSYKIIVVPIVFLLKTVWHISLFILQMVKTMILFLILPVEKLMKLIIPKKVFNFISKIVSFCSTMVSKLIHLLRNFFSKKRR